jgi:hypothetical protein
MNLEVQRNSILRRIIEKGGLVGLAAEMCYTDETKSNGVIKEFFEQIHHESLRAFWGLELSLDLIAYRVRYLRIQFESIYEKTGWPCMDSINTHALSHTRNSSQR